MKISGKPISSPGRAEKFPPPLMRFLRTNVGSRSRGRSKSSPIFFKKKNNNTAAAIETQAEPTSPKVTCMGQVRVARSKKKKAPGPTKKPARLPRKPCFSISPLSCPVNFRWKKVKPNCSFLGCFRWVSCCRVVSGRKVESREDSMRKDSNFVNNGGDNNYTLKVKRDVNVEEAEDQEEEEEPHHEEQELRVYESSFSAIPPRNALLLTRCRSAPYRSSSLASRFWDSPLKDEETTQQENSNKASSLVGDKKVPNFEEEDDEESSKPISKKGSERDDEEKGSIRERMRKSANDSKACEEEEGGGGGEEEEEDGGSVSRRPLILTRCKSEPARTASKKLDPEMNFWRKRRLDSADSLSPHAM